MTIADLETIARSGYSIQCIPRYGPDENTAIGYWWRVEFFDFENFTSDYFDFAAVSETSLADAIGQVLAEYRAALAGDRLRRCN